jgi:hypothetical protein
VKCFPERPHVPLSAVTILEEDLACQPGVSARQCYLLGVMLWLSDPALLLPATVDLEQHQCLIVTEADDGIAAGRIHPAIMADTGTIRTCRWQRRVAAVTVTRWLPLALTGHDDTDDASSGHGGAATMRPRPQCVEGPDDRHTRAGQRLAA